ncbi:hypothetical protein CVT25_001549 [Psilocybe cyanescens]|uniref:HMG box domain-containing protein n=1 Tax=Psilocybe cyanescens TaxID=93625 RepID=A0A409WPU6_PSICY|nr:hypothetical protein CVT25_001549 [Psilocybe cyanescens]
MLFTVLRISRAHSAISNAAFSHARPTVSSLVATRSFLTTAWVEAAKKDAKSTKTTRATAKKVKSKVSGSKAAEKSEKEKALAKTKKESGLKEKVAKATEKVLTKEKAKARREKALAIKKANALKLKEKAKLQREKVRLIRQKVNEEKEKERLAIKNARRPPFKKPKTAYTNFMSQTMNGQDLGTDRTEILKQSAKVWSSMSEEEKTKYAVDPKERVEYLVKYNAWKATLTPKERRIRRKNNARGTIQAYNVFMKENFPKKLEGGMTFIDASRTLRERYLALSEDEKAEYRKKADAILAARNEAKEQANTQKAAAA